MRSSNHNVIGPAQPGSATRWPERRKTRVLRIASEACQGKEGQPRDVRMWPDHCRNPLHSTRNTASFHFLFGLHMDCDHQVPISALNVSSIRSQIVCAAATVMPLAPPNGIPGTCSRPAWRVRRSCASIAPAALLATSSLIRFTTAGSGAASISPLTEPEIIPCPTTAHRPQWRPPNSGSSTSRPVLTTRSNPTAIPAEVTTSASRCRPSACKRGRPQFSSDAAAERRPDRVDRRRARVQREASEWHLE